MDLEFYPSGKLKCIQPQLDGKPHGMARFFDEAGTCRSISHFRQGNRHGEARYFYPKGRTRMIQPWVRGEIHGYVVYLYETGKIKAIESHKHSKREGKARYYAEDGAVQAELIYKDDELWGVGNPVSR